MTTDMLPGWGRLPQVPNPVNRMPLQLVDELTELQERKRALKSQIKVIEEREAIIDSLLIAHAQNAGVSIIRGSGKEVTVTNKSRWQFPLSNDSPSEYEAMDAALRRSQFWGEVSSVNHCKLQAYALRGESPELLEII
jgi:hypothetical protein